MNEELIPDGEIHILNEGMAYCLKCYENDMELIIHEEANLLAKKYLDYINEVNPKHLEEEFRFRILSSFFPCGHQLDDTPQLSWRRPYKIGSIEKKATLCMKFYRLENDESFFDKHKTYFGELPDHPISIRTTHDSN